MTLTVKHQSRFSVPDTLSHLTPYPTATQTTMRKSQYDARGSSPLEMLSKPDDATKP